MRKVIYILVLLICAGFSKLKAQESRYAIKNVKINNKYSNFGTTFYGSGKVVYASPEKKTFIRKNIWKGNNQPFLDLYIGDISKDGDILNPEKFSDKINTRYHEADVTFTKDLKTIYFTRNNYHEGKYRTDSKKINRLKIFKATITSKGELVDVVSLPFNDDQYSVGHPSLSADERTLYFTSDMPGSIGGTDIFKVTIFQDGTYGTPENLGPEINTVKQEMFPYIDGNEMLYFSSNGRDGTGGLDIYVSKITSTEITEPLNLESPINSEKDDFGFIIDTESRRGFFSSNRVGGKGDDDIYSFLELSPVSIKENCNQQIAGEVRDKETGGLIPGATVYLYKKIDSVVVGKDGRYSFDVDCEAPYKIVGTEKNYNDDTKEITTTGIKDSELDLALNLSPVEFVHERGKTMVKINPIYFDLNSSYIRADARPELDKVVAIMKKYPNMIIECGSHTDSRQTFEYNEWLSARRAKSTIQYIVSKGISPNRISGRGYGEYQLTNKCSDGVKCSEEEHQQNRRTEFVVVKM